MRKPKNKFLEFLQIFSFKKKRNKFARIENYKLYKEQEQLNLGKKRKSFTLNIKLNKSKRNFKRIFLGIILFCLLGIFISIIYIFTGPTFRIKYIEAIKQDELVNINMIYKSLENIRGKVIFDIEKEAILERTTSYQESIKSISMKKKLPNTLYLEIESYKPSFNISINKEKYLLLRNGSLVPVKVYNPDLMYLGIENTFEDSKFLSYKKVYKQKTIQKIEEIIKQVSLNIGAGVTANYYQKERELHLFFNNQTITIFTLDTDVSIKEQIKSLMILHKEGNEILSGKNVYIDLRIKDKAFLCPFENEGSCRYNLRFLYPDIERPNVQLAQPNEQIEKQKEAN